MFLFRRIFGCALLSAATTSLAPCLAAQVVQLAPQVVTATRAPQPPEQLAATIKVMDAGLLRRVPAATVDSALRTIPGFSLFRRSDSLVAHPTAQGVSLRGLGPSGASRSLVLLDGVPLNDPFGGWVAWTKVPREGLARVELVPGGGSSAWGNAALGGVVQLLDEITTSSSGSVVATAGDYGIHSVELDAGHAFPHDAVQLRGRVFGFDGFSLVAPERRGPIDVGAWSRHRWLTGTWRHSVGSTLQLGATIRGFEERRGNGTPYQQNASREKFLSLNAVGAVSGHFSWETIGYAQDQSFSSTFSSVNAARTAETPASDQFAVPSTAFGVSWIGRWRHHVEPASSQTTAGIDTRFVRGETRENFTYTAGTFTRQRVAGGRQAISGLFVSHDRQVLQDWHAMVAARVDAWREAGGHRRETDRTSDGLLREEQHADRSDTEFSPSAGLVWHPAGRPDARLRAHVQHAFRRPTLNELYRPFRVGPNVTEANPHLETEQVTSAELGVEWTIGSAPPSAGGSRAAPGRAALTVGATAFWNDFRDAVGNVTIARGPGTFPIVGFVTAGGVGRQRLNLERSRVQGIELSARWRPRPGLSVLAEYLYNDATVTRAVRATGLVGRRIAQVPRHGASISGTVAAPLRLNIAPRLRWIGRQFEDDENLLILGEVVVADFGVSRALGPRAELFVNIENVGDARIETGRTSDGLVNVGTPRLFMAGVRTTW